MLKERVLPGGQPFLLTSRSLLTSAHMNYWHPGDLTSKILPVWGNVKCSVLSIGRNGWLSLRVERLQEKNRRQKKTQCNDLRLGEPLKQGSSQLGLV